jgi:hypothetical protein
MLVYMCNKFDHNQVWLLTLIVATPLWPSVRMKLTLPKLGTWSPPGLPKTQSLMAGVKTPCIRVFLVSLERSWSLDVQNGLTWVIWTSSAQVMGKRKAGSQTGSRESTRSRRALGECDMALESSRGELPDWFRPHLDRRLGREVMMAQSLRSPNRDSFETPLWESRDKEPLGCGRGGATQRILYGGRWWLPPSPGRGESSESKVARGLSQHQMDAEWVLTNLGLVLDARLCNNIIVPLPSLILGLLAHPSTPFKCWKLGAAPNFQLFATQHTWTLKWVQQGT